MQLLRRSVALVALPFLVACLGSSPLAAPTATPPQATVTPQPTPLPTAQPYSVPGFENFLAEARNARREQRQDLVNRYTALVTEAPLTADNRAVFLWRGEAFTVQLVGDMNNWNLAEASQLTRLEGTDLWYLQGEYEPDARLDYQFVINGEDWHLDPLNPLSVPGSVGPNSELVMPGYQVPPELLPAEETIPPGTVSSHTVESIHLNQTRTFFVYTPPGQIVGEKLSSVYVNDGGDYMNLIDAPAILDRLIVNRQIPPVVAVFIPPINRNTEYGLEDAYIDFLADELVPFVRETYGTDEEPATTAALGSSLGGLAAIYAALARPDVFGLAAGQSGTYSFDEDRLVRRMIAEQNTGGSPGRHARWYLVAGTYETAIAGEDDTINVLAANRRLVESLRTLGGEYQYEERPEGHSWGLWRGTFGQALGYLFNP